MKKKRFAIVLALLMVLTLTACGEETDASTPTITLISRTEDSTQISSESGDEEIDTQTMVETDNTADSTQLAANVLSPEMQAMVDSVNLDTAECSGVCGPNLAWYYRGGVLVISGNGPMNDFSWTDGSAPWKDLYYDTSLIYLSEGVTSVGESAFRDFWLLNRVVLPDSLESIGWYAFDECENLLEMTIPSGVKYVGEDALGGNTITFLGDAPEPIEDDGSERWDIFAKSATVHYSGAGFESYMQYYQDSPNGADITWVKD